MAGRLLSIDRFRSRTNIQSSAASWRSPACRAVQTAVFHTVSGRINTPGRNSSSGSPRRSAKAVALPFRPTLSSQTAAADGAENATFFRARRVRSIFDLLLTFSADLRFRISSQALKPLKPSRSTWSRHSASSAALSKSRRAPFQTLAERSESAGARRLQPSEPSS